MAINKICKLKQAKKLKELGCIGLTYDYKFKNNEDKPIHMTYYDYILSNEVGCPYICEALDWFREVKGVTCAVDFYAYKDSITYSGVIYNGEDNLYTNDYENHGDASSALLDALIEYEMNKSK